jgi:hypothetical protein
VPGKCFSPKVTSIFCLFQIRKIEMLNKTYLENIFISSLLFRCPVKTTILKNKKLMNFGKKLRAKNL